MLNHISPNPQKFLKCRTLQMFQQSLCLPDDALNMPRHEFWWYALPRVKQQHGPLKKKRLAWNLGGFLNKIPSSWMLWDPWRKESFLCSDCSGTNVIACSLILASSAGVIVLSQRRLFTNKNSPQFKNTDQVQYPGCMSKISPQDWAEPPPPKKSFSAYRTSSSSAHSSTCKVPSGWSLDPIAELRFTLPHSLWITPARRCSCLSL